MEPKSFQEHNQLSDKHTADSYITPDDLKRMFVSAYYRVRDKREDVNKINVFPVPDQDTGDNLTRTLKGIHDSLILNQFDTITELRTVILDGALSSASGNIGIIITGFISGFLNPLLSDEIPAVQLSEGFKEGSRQAYESIQSPKKGTVLDVIEAVSLTFLNSDNNGGGDDIINLLIKSIDNAQIALKNTQNLLAIYKKTDTVDAGAYGFVLMMQGFLDGLQNTHIDYEGVDKIEGGKKEMFIQILSNKYEVVSLLDSPNKNKQEILSLLEPLGDSIDIVEANNKVKIHIHTDYSDEVIKTISTFGDVLQMRKYDMTKGPEEFEKDTVSIGIVADEGASLPLQIVAENDIAVVPFKTSWEKIEEHPELKNNSLYENMRNIRKKTDEYGWPRTSQPPQKAYYEAYKDQLKKYSRVLCFTFSSKVSGAYNSALQAKKMLPEKDRERVFIPDLMTGGGGQGLAVLESIRLAKIGLETEDILKRIADIVRDIKVDVFLSELTWVIEGGRVPRAKGVLLKILRIINIHPIFMLKAGKLSLKRLQLGKSSLAERVYKEVKREYKGKNIKIVINHADGVAEVEKLKELLCGLSHEVVYESALPPVLGIHAGPDAITVSYLV